MMLSSQKPMAPSSVCRKSSRAFTLVEVLVAVALTFVVVGGGFAFLKLVLGQSNPPAASFNGEFYQQAPAPSQGYAAVRLYGRWLDCVHAANEVYVLGGSGQNPAAAAGIVAATPKPLAMTFSATSIAGLGTATDPLCVARPSPIALYTALSGSADSGANAAGNFTVITVTGANTVSSVLQCRRYSDTANAYYRVRLASGAGLSVVDTYGVLVPLRIDVWTLLPGATTYWYGSAGTDIYGRFNTPFYRIVLPDPMLRSGQGVIPFSRFTKHVQGSR